MLPPGIVTPRGHAGGRDAQQPSGRRCSPGRRTGWRRPAGILGRRDGPEHEHVRIAMPWPAPARRSWAGASSAWGHRRRLTPATAGSLLRPPRQQADAAAGSPSRGCSRTRGLPRRMCPVVPPRPAAQDDGKRSSHVRARVRRGRPSARRPGHPGGHPGRRAPRPSGPGIRAGCRPGCPASGPPVGRVSRGRADSAGRADDQAEAAAQRRRDRDGPVPLSQQGGEPSGVRLIHPRS